MHISEETLKQFLISSAKIAPESIKQAENTAQQTGRSFEQTILDQRIISEQELTAFYAGSLKLPFIDLSNVNIAPEILSRIPEQIAKKYQVILFGRDNESNTWQLAVSDPTNTQVIDIIKKQLNAKLQVYVATRGDILSALNQYRVNSNNKASQNTPKTTAPDSSAKKPEPASAEDISENSPIAKTVNVILEYALKSNASDVHIEPRESIVQIRYRIDGLLRESMTLPRQTLPAVISRIKTLADLMVNEHHVPQEGRFKTTIGAKTITAHVTILPIVDGEKIVMRIMNESAKMPTLEELGFSKQALRLVNESIKRSDGMILVAGPTGSGKSTTLYSILSLMNTPGVNVSTIEDPVEYQMPGVNQTQVDFRAGITFTNGLRALLKQDPDIIMVGELGDTETANLAMQTVLTGRAVLSTIHTNNTSATPPRLLDMGAEPFLITSTVKTIIAQRLVRKLCVKCKTPYTPSGTLLDEIESTFDLARTIPFLANNSTPQPPAPAQRPPSKPIANSAPSLRTDTSRKVIPVPENLDLERRSILDRIAQDPNIIDRPSGDGDNSSIGLSPEDINPTLPSKQSLPGEEKIQQIADKSSQPTNDESISFDEMPPATTPNVNADTLVLYRAVGCKECGDSGYSGRLGIYEVLDISTEIKALIASKAPADKIREIAIAKGMVSLQEDGLTKALQGMTSIEEVMRATRE